MKNILENEFTGVYGKYTITHNDKKEVRNYRLSLLVCAISFLSGLIHWVKIGENHAWLWLIPMIVSLGFALKWIHIYIQFLHKSLQVLWAIGSLGITILIFKESPHHLLSSLASKSQLILLIGPYFAAMTGLGFKEFFCFQRPEAIGLTFLLPISLLGHFLRIINPEIVMILLFTSAILLLILALRKFGMEASLDIGDKSVFEYLERPEIINIS